MSEEPGYYDSQADTDRRRGASLPHWSQAATTYYVTFRLADSLPAAVQRAWESERREVAQDRLIDEAARERLLRRLYSKHIESGLDRGYGDCWLARPGCADVVAASLSHFDGERYRLWCWCVMPNHVHVLVEPWAPYSLSAVLHSWKTYSANGVNRLVGRSGALWQKESFDHLVRRRSAFDYFSQYILTNPARAGLGDWPHYGGTGLPAGER